MVFFHDPIIYNHLFSTISPPIYNKSMKVNCIERCWQPSWWLEGCRAWCIRQSTMENAIQCNGHRNYVRCFRRHWIQGHHRYRQRTESTMTFVDQVRKHRLLSMLASAFPFWFSHYSFCLKLILAIVIVFDWSDKMIADRWYNFQSFWSNTANVTDWFQAVWTSIVYRIRLHFEKSVWMDRPKWELDSHWNLKIPHHYRFH